MAGISGKRAVRAFERAGFSAQEGKGSHVTLKKRGSPIIVIPLHREVAPYLIQSQIKRAGMAEDEFLALLK